MLSIRIIKNKIIFFISFRNKIVSFMPLLFYIFVLLQTLDLHRFI